MDKEYARKLKDHRKRYNKDKLSKAEMVLKLGY